MCVRDSAESECGSQPQTGRAERSGLPPRQDRLLQDRLLQFCRGNKFLNWDQVSPVEAKIAGNNGFFGVLGRQGYWHPQPCPLWGTELHRPCVPFLPPLVLHDKPQGIIRFTLNEPSYPPISMSLPLDSEVLGRVINGFSFYRGPKRQDNKNKQAHCQ